MCMDTHYLEFILLNQHLRYGKLSATGLALVIQQRDSASLHYSYPLEPGQHGWRQCQVQCLKHTVESYADQKRQDRNEGYRFDLGALFWMRVP
jgi:hypothetical protein